MKKTLRLLRTCFTWKFRQTRGEEWRQLGRYFAWRGLKRDSELAHDIAECYRLPFILHVFAITIVATPSAWELERRKIARERGTS